MNSGKNRKFSNEELQDLIIESDSGARRPRGLTAKLLVVTALLWSLFQVWIASPLPYTWFIADFLSIPVLNSTDARFFHLSFAMLIAFLAYPAFKHSPRRYVPLYDWIFASLALFSILYLYFQKDSLAIRIGSPEPFDMFLAVSGIFVLLEAARRALGPPLVIIGLVFLLYSFAGPYMPDVIAHKGQSLGKIGSHQWLTNEGVFGIAIGVSTDFVFLFVLFGALLEKAGAGNYFIQLAFSLLGHLKGGPAKAAVLASGMTGLISGSSIANTVTTGTFTVPLMRKVGFSREKAGAVEVASSVNGQIMPPVMGAAAFLMVEYVGISYVEVVKHAFIPALISYIALFYIVHLEALKANMSSLPKRYETKLRDTLLRSAIIISGFILLSGIVYFTMGWIKGVAGGASPYIAATLVVISYAGLLFYASKSPDLEMDDPNAPIVELPDTAATVKTGLHHLLPIFVLVWCLMVEHLSPGLSAFWATAFMIVIVLTQKPLMALFRGQGDRIKKQAFSSFIDMLDGFIAGARNMTGIAIATAAAGIIVGSVSLTGIGQVMTELVEYISGGSFVLVLVFTAIICLILGMGLPTTANYIVVSSLMAVVIEELGRQNGLAIPLIAVHLFVFYFGIMADVTPPVGLASFAAAAVSGGDPIKTGVQAFIYSIRTVILPFIFIYNTELLLVGVDNWFVAIVIFVKATIAILIFAAATQGYFLVKSRAYESVLLLMVAFALFRPDFWVDVVTPPYKQAEIGQIAQVIDAMEEGQQLKMRAEGINQFGEDKNFYSYFPVATGKAARQLEEYGLIIEQEKTRVLVTDVIFASKAETAGFDFDYIITDIYTPEAQIHKYWVYLIAIIMLIFVVFSQRRRL